MAEKDPKGSGQQLEQFVLLSKSTRGAGIVALINQALEASGVYVFGELLEMPNVQEVWSFIIWHTIKIWINETAYQL